MSPTNVSSAAVNGETLKLGTTLAPNAMGFQRLFTNPGHHPFDEIIGEVRTVSNLNQKGRPILERRVANMPASDLIDSTPFKSYRTGRLNAQDRCSLSSLAAARWVAMEDSRPLNKKSAGKARGCELQWTQEFPRCVR